METRSLSKIEIDKIVLQAKAKSPTQKIPYFSTYIVEVAEAFRDNKSHVTIDGRGFSIKRTPHYGGSIVINPDVGFVPCGYISYRTLKQALEDPNAL